MMCICVQVYRDRYCNIVGYRLKNTTNGSIFDIEPNDLKNKLSTEQLSVENIKLTADNRIMLAKKRYAIKTVFLERKTLYES
jgi:hypothetical protein